MTPEEEAARLAPCEAPELCEAEYKCGVCLIRPAVAAALRERDAEIQLLKAEMEGCDQQRFVRQEERIAELEARNERLREALDGLRG